METDIALMASGYLLVRLAALAAFGYLVYRVLRGSPKRMPVRIQSNYANERRQASRFDR